MDILGEILGEECYSVYHNGRFGIGWDAAILAFSIKNSTSGNFSLYLESLNLCTSIKNKEREENLKKLMDFLVYWLQPSAICCRKKNDISYLKYNNNSNLLIKIKLWPQLCLQLFHNLQYLEEVLNFILWNIKFYKNWEIIFVLAVLRIKYVGIFYKN